MSSQALTPQSEDFSKWYNEIVLRADLADHAPVRGCMIIKPYGYELWENLKNALDKRFKATGHKNAYFPLFIPLSFIQKEAEHVEGFAPELAIVTHAGGEELEEPLVVRPTSETVIGHSFAQWIQSYRDLPLLINQWANVVRWEKRPRLFLRTSEFLWQEGHTAHASFEEAQEETLRMLDIYAEVATNEAALPVIKGRKSSQEKFAGADSSYTVEALMKDGRALQSGTSHNLGQNFAKVFEIKYLDRNNETQLCWTTSWGMSARMIGGIIMTHGDDRGLRLPPRLAPIQVVIVPIYKNDTEKSAVQPIVERAADSLLSVNIRTHVDDREEYTPGFKYNDWEMRGVPIRLEIGPKDVKNGTFMLARRDIAGKEGKQSVDQHEMIPAVNRLLNDIQRNLLHQATEFRDSRLREAATYDELKEIVASGLALIWHCDTKACEDRIQEETRASSRCYPSDLNTAEPPKGRKCVVCGKPARGKAYFGRSY